MEESRKNVLVKVIFQPSFVVKRKGVVNDLFIYSENVFNLTVSPEDFFAPEMP